MRAYRVILAVLAVLPAIETAHAERKYRVGTQLDLAGAGTDSSFQAVIEPVQFEERRTFSYSAYPSIEIESRGKHSLFTMSYVFGFNRTSRDLAPGTYSHLGSASFRVTLNPRWNLSLEDSFQMTPDFTSLNVIRGIIDTPGASEHSFYPIAARQSSHINNARGGIEYRFSEKSSVGFGVAHSLRNYGESPATFGRLSDQNHVEGRIDFTRRTSERTYWDVRYSYTYYQFSRFGNSRTQRVAIGYSRELRPTLTLLLSAGPSYVEALDGSHGNYPGYSASLALQKRLERNILSIYYARDSGGGSGLGSISDIDRAGFGLDRQLSRRIYLTLDISGFVSRGRLDNPFRTRGASGASSIGIALSRTLSLNFGAQYHRYDRAANFGFEDRRVFTSLRFRAPELWRFIR